LIQYLTVFTYVGFSVHDCHCHKIILPKNRRTRTCI